MSPRKTARRILRAIIYVRVSSFDTSAEEAANNSPDVQRARCLARITAEGWELATDVGDGGVIFDLDVSGSDKGMRLNRPGLLVARNAIKARRADVIVSLRLDRLARNTIDLLTLAEELESHGGAFALAEGHQHRGFVPADHEICAVRQRHAHPRMPWAQRRSRLVRTSGLARALARPLRR